MKMLALSILCILPLTAFAQVHDLLVVCGQSNAVGYDAAGSTFVGQFADQDIRFWYRVGDPPPDHHDVASRVWTFLRVQPKGDPMPKGKMGRQYGNFSSLSGGFGPEVGLARSIQRENVKPVAVLKVAFSGTKIEEWQVDEPCFKALAKEYVAAVEAANLEGFELKPRAFFWVQGESDANPALAPLYAERLTKLITAVRTETKSPKLPAFFAVNERFGGAGKKKWMGEIIAAQQKAADTLPHCVRVDTSKATIANGAHWDTKGTLSVGRWFAEALKKAEVQK